MLLCKYVCLFLTGSDGHCAVTVQLNWTLGLDNGLKYESVAVTGFIEMTCPLVDFVLWLRLLFILSVESLDNKQLSCLF